jgi:hypothetical protein
VTLVGWELMADAIVSSFLFLSVLLALVASTMAKSMLHLLRGRMEAHRMRAPTAAAETGVPAVVRLVVDKEEVASELSQPVERVGAATRRRAVQAQAR